MKEFLNLCQHLAELWTIYQDVRFLEHLSVGLAENTEHRERVVTTLSYINCEEIVYVAKL